MRERLQKRQAQSTLGKQRSIAFSPLEGQGRLSGGEDMVSDSGPDISILPT